MDLRRRHALFGLCCVGTSWSAGRRAWGGQISAAVTVEVAPGLHVRRGIDEDATVDNEDAIANTAFVIGGTCVAVLDPGGCLRDGLALRARVRAVTDKPIRYVILSHIHPDHIFGAAAFRPDGATFLGHASLPDALRSRGDFYRRGLETLLGRGEAGDIVYPDQLVTGHAEIDLGGRILELRAHRVAHTNCDLSALDRETGTWLAGDMLFVQRVPSLDGDLRGWIAELDALQALPAGRAVPGHGPPNVPWPEAAADHLRYLRALRREVGALIQSGGNIEQAPQAAVGERSRWTLFDDYNGRNATEAFKELEWDQ